MLTSKNHIEMFCENPDCTVSYKWVEEEIANDAEKLPDPVFRFLILAGFMGGKHTFCSKYCLLEWLRTYTAPKSPREERLEKEEREKETERIAKLAEEGMENEGGIKIQS